MDNTRTIDEFDEIKALFETRNRQAIEVGNKKGEKQSRWLPKILQRFRLAREGRTENKLKEVRRKWFQVGQNGTLTKKWNKEISPMNTHFKGREK